MKIQELIRKYEELWEAHSPFHEPVPYTSMVELFLKELKQLDEPQKVKVPQFVADWYEEHKENLEYNIWDWMKYNLEPKKQENVIFSQWLGKTVNNPVETLIKMKLYGYEVKKEKRYTVVMKGTKQPLYYNASDDKLFFSMGKIASHFTRQQLEKLNFGWVFDSPGFQIEEVTE
jgi:gp178|nr:MAG TPA: Protein of unknown function (DUF1642) [Caudoviricetes sp.]